jgi:hypothetical protein
MPAAPLVVSWKRLALVGAAATLLVLIAGRGFERIRFGADESATVQRLVREVRSTLAGRERSLRLAATGLMAESTLAEALY